MMRRSARLFQSLTEFADLTQYELERDARYEDDAMFLDLYNGLAERGFALKPYEQAVAYSRGLRSKYDAELEFLIDFLEAPRGFWGHAIGLRRADFALESQIER